MSVSVQPRGGRFQLRVRHRLLSAPFFFTFDSEPEARAYGRNLRDLLDRGIVPAELAAKPAPRADPLLVECIRAYTKGAPITASDDALLGTMLEELAGVRESQVTNAWAGAYIRRLKVKRNLSPGSIRKRIGALARVLDWAARQAERAPAHPLRTLPHGYSLYSQEEAAEAVKAGGERKVDVQRDRRLLPDEEARVVAVLQGFKREDRERAFGADADLLMLFRLVLDTGLRLSEAYRLRAEQVDLRRRIINVEGSKGHRGQIKPRVVPIRAALAERLAAYIGERAGLVFPFWNGTPEDNRRCGRRLSARFSVLFDYARVPDFTEHDLRHEATCRWVELRNDRGWVFSEIEVCKIMGWTDPRLMLRYASLRGEDLAARLA